MLENARHKRAAAEGGPHLTRYETCDNPTVETLSTPNRNFFEVFFRRQGNFSKSGSLEGGDKPRPYNSATAFLRYYAP